jgi:GT2 family glycosyltransferase
MPAGKAERITIVLPSYNRAAALRANLRSTLAVKDVDEVLVVNDGSADDTVAACGEIDDRRLRLISHERNLGVAAARNTGIEHASGDWILFSEDDCRFPADYATILLGEAQRAGADIVGAPLLNVAGSDEEVAQHAARATRTTHVSMDDTSIFPVEAVETPFVPARALVRKAVFDRVRFYEGYLVNGYREETDFFVQAARAGFTCVLTPETYCYQAGFWGGGQHHSSTLRYEYWTVRNNWRFLKRHGRWLQSRGDIRSVPGAQLGFTAFRLRRLFSGAVRARIARARSALSRSRARAAAS